MEEELVVKADATTVEAPSAGNVVMDAPTVNMNVEAVEITPLSVEAGAVEVEPVTQSSAPEPAPQTTTGEPVTRTSTPEPKLEVQSQQDSFASAFRYQPTVPESQNQGTDYFGNGQGNSFQGNVTQGNYFQGNGYPGQNYGQTQNFNGAGQDYYGANQGYYGYSAPQNNFGANQGAYGAPQNPRNPGNYSGKNDPYGSYNPGEYSQPDIYGQDVYANDAFASYYDEDEPNRQGNGLAIGALICGIASLSFTCTYFGFIPGIIAIVLGSRGATECSNKTMAKTGMILGICGVVAGIIMIGSAILRITTGILENI